MEPIIYQFFKNFSTPNGFREEASVVDAIRTGVVKDQIEQLRRCKSQATDPETYKRLKTSLPAFTASATFKGERRSENVDIYNGIVILDLDKVTDPQQLQQINDTICNCPHTLINFISPSGEGSKTFVRVNTPLEHHSKAFNQVKQYYEQLTGVTFDPSTCDVTRLTFLPHHPGIYYYPDCDFFPVNTEEAPTGKLISMYQALPTQWDTAYEKAYAYAQKKGAYEEGNRNNFVFTLACGCNGYGMPSEVLLQKLSWCDLPQQEILSTVTSAYRKKEWHGRWTITAPKSKEAYLKKKGSDKISFAECMSDTPTIPEELKLRLPSLISEYALSYEDERQSDISLITLLTVLSSIMDGVSGCYRRQIHCANLFSMIVAPPATGKIVASESASVFTKLHRQIKDNAGLERPYGLFLPMNTTASSFIRVLARNDAKGVLYTQDADFIGYALKNDGAGYHATLRSCYSHESITSGRMQKGRVIELSDPQLSVVAMATPSQVNHFIPSVEDGLFSRFLPYAFSSSGVWSDIKPTDITQMVELQGKTSAAMIDVFEHYQNVTLKFNWSDTQMLAANEVFSELFAQAGCIVGPSMESVVKRLGIAAFKISMIITAIRAWEQTREVGEWRIAIECSDDDFDLTMGLIQIFYEHALYLHAFLVEQEEEQPDNPLHQFYTILPDNFERKEALERAKAAGIKVSDRTIDNFLKRLVKAGWLIKEYNKYQKVNVTTKVA